MPAWKVMLIGLLAGICLALAMATILIPMDMQGNDRWIWLGGLLAGTFLAGTLLTLFLRRAGLSLDTNPNRSRN